jgi:predicted DCC family thiol-disulfide oxidoreductase YuxK
MPLQFTSLQSEAGKALLAQHHLDKTYIDSLVYIADGQAFTHSDAALQLARHLKNPYRSLTVFKLLPKPLRDYLYTQIARHRYAWFGKKEACWLPTPALKARFIDE